MAIKLTSKRLEDFVSKRLGRKVCYWGYYLGDNYRKLLPRVMAFVDENGKLISIKEETILKHYEQGN